MFSQRSYNPELLDNPDIPSADLFKNLQELEFINKYLGGHEVVLKSVQRLLKDHPLKRQIHILEIGSGGGDNLRAIAKWGKKNGYDLKLTGVDLKETCTSFAKKRSKSSEIAYVTTDYRKAKIEKIGKPDIIFNSLFCHHFTDEQLVEMMIWMADNSTIGYTICDLHRHPLAYYSIKFLTSFFSRSYLVKNDAPLSVLRGFRKNELRSLLRQAHQNHSTISWAWAFRWIVTVKNKGLR